MLRSFDTSVLIVGAGPVGRFDRDVAVDGLVAAAKRRGVPFKVLHIDDAEAATLYAKKLVLVRPDRHVAWRADVEPDDPLALIDLIRGAPAMISRERVLATARSTDRSWM
jgi:hypothetical protein